MLPQVGSSELFLIAIIALIVIGPKDLPVMLRKLGKFVGRLRGMANEFRSSFDEMARQSELDDLRNEVAAMREAAVSQAASAGEAARALQNQMGPLNGPDIIDGAHSPDDPEAYMHYPESTAEKIINRRQKVAETEGSPKPVRVKTRAAKPTTVETVATPVKAKAPARAKPPAKTTSAKPAAAKPAAPRKAKP